MNCVICNKSVREKENLLTASLLKETNCNKTDIHIECLLEHILYIKCYKSTIQVTNSKIDKAFKSFLRYKRHSKEYTHIRELLNSLSYSVYYLQ